MASSFAGRSKPALVDTWPQFPQHKIKADASFGGTTIYENLEFINFKSGYTQCGMKQRMFVLNYYNADYYPIMRVLNSKLYGYSFGFRGVIVRGAGSMTYSPSTFILF
jgi:hypothetical protein